MNKKAHTEVQEAIKSIQNCLVSAQNFFYYHEEDQLKNKDKRGWSSIEYFEHFNMILFHQIGVMKSVKNSSKGIFLPKIFRVPFEELSYTHLLRKKKKEFLYNIFIPISISNPGVQLNAQKVFEDLLHGVAELSKLSDSYTGIEKIIIDPKIPGLISFHKKICFIADYMKEIVEYCKGLTQ